MRKKLAMMLACAAAGGLTTLTSAAHGATFTENFNSGDVTDGGFWSTAAVTNPSNVAITEPVGGPLNISISTASPASTLEGGYIQSGPSSSNTFDFTKAPLLMILNAPVVNGVQTSLAPPNGGGSAFTNNAFTYLGVDVGGATEQGDGGPYTGASRVDSGVDKAYVALNSANTLEFSLEYFDTSLPSGHQANAFINYTFYQPAVTIPAGAPITSMFLYLDAADAANGNFWINCGCTYIDPTTHAATTVQLEGPAGGHNEVGTVPFNVDPATGITAYNDGNKGNGWYGNLTPAEDQAIFTQFNGHVDGAVEVDDTAGDTTPGNSVSFGQLIVGVPEPTSFGLVAVGAGMLLRRKRNRV